MWMRQPNESGESVWKCEDIEKKSDAVSLASKKAFFPLCFSIFFQEVVVSLVTRANILYGFWSV